MHTRIPRVYIHEMRVLGPPEPDLLSQIIYWPQEEAHPDAVSLDDHAAARAGDWFARNAVDLCSDTRSALQPPPRARLRTTL